MRFMMMVIPSRTGCGSRRGSGGKDDGVQQRTADGGRPACTGWAVPSSRYWGTIKKQVSQSRQALPSLRSQRRRIPLCSQSLVPIGVDQSRFACRVQLCRLLLVQSPTLGP
jgi:hypothetical protein